MYTALLVLSAKAFLLSMSTAVARMGLMKPDTIRLSLNLFALDAALLSSAVHAEGGRHNHAGALAKYRRLRRVVREIRNQSA